MHEFLLHTIAPHYLSQYFRSQSNQFYWQQDRALIYIQILHIFRGACFNNYSYHFFKSSNVYLRVIS